MITRGNTPLPRGAGVAVSVAPGGPVGPLARAPALTPARLVAGVHAAPARDTGGRLGDDVARPAPRNDRD
ncbi:hypothetical protein AB0D46_23400 [Streptomyces sp. NPDC048383]|uniref:hypothetical protein n=1 Tax=Streptomyces sp. NPDC048383 TaxID=3155386 RepID=UPI003435AF32